MTDAFHIAVFAKAPVPGAVKTRLIPLLGDHAAAQAHRQMTHHALQIATAAAPGHVSLWSGGLHQHEFLRECHEHFNVFAYPQCDGDIGNRMADCFARLLPQSRRVLLIGSDCPVLSVTDLRDAAAALDEGARMVFTPAEDGGYVLVGARRFERLGSADADPDVAAAFEAIDWSTAAVMNQTRQALVARGWSAGKQWREMAQRWDVDTPDDYLRALREGLLLV